MAQSRQGAVYLPGRWARCSVANTRAGRLGLGSDAWKFWDERALSGHNTRRGMGWSKAVSARSYRALH